jgi:hypothetical protein
MMISNADLSHVPERLILGLKVVPSSCDVMRVCKILNELTENFVGFFYNSFVRNLGT